MEQDLRSAIERIRAVIAEDGPSTLRKVLEDWHPADIAEVLEHLEPREQEVVLEAFDDEVAASVILELPYEDQARLLSVLSPARAASVLDHMPSDDIADLLGDIEEEQAQSILRLLARDDAVDVRRLLAYQDDTAGGIMTTELIALREDLTVEEAIEHLRRIAPDAETIYYVYVVDAEDTLVGVLSLRDLIIAPPSAAIGEIMSTKVIAVQAEDDQEEVARVVARYDLLAVPVVNHQGRLMGIVTVDDVIDVIEEEATEDIHRMMAASTEEAEDTVWSKVRKRLPWLVLLLIGNVLSASVLRHYSMAIESLVALAYFVPILMDQSGNVGVQSLTVVVRGLATGEVQARDVWRIISRELRVGLLLGLFTGSLVAGVALVWQGEPLLGLVIGLAMVSGLTTAALMGTVVPLVFNRLGIDPAVASGPFITTAADVTGLLIYFGLASILLGHLLA